jgi:hypothetical protein
VERYNDARISTSVAPDFEAVSSLITGIAVPFDVLLMNVTDRL